MKDRIMNALMLFTVAAALILTLLRGAPETESAFDAPMISGIVTALPTEAPHPAP